MGPSEQGRQEKARAQIAARVTEIWAKLISRPEVDQHSDFYFNGGSHLLAPEMVRCVNEALGLELTVRDLEQARTIARLTDLIHFRQTRIDHSTVVPLRNAHESRPPLFILHGEGGHVLGFYSLAKCMNTDQPVYAIQAQALISGEEALLGLEQMAARYIEDMRAISPKGPYHLLGLSFGGLVAYEIAQQLHSAGASVGLLAMLDTRQPQYMRVSPARGYWRLKLVYLGAKGRKNPLGYFCLRLKQWMVRATYMRAVNKGRGTVASVVRNVRQINRVAGLNYTVQPYPGKVNLFRAEDDPLDGPLPRDLNWGRFAGGGLAVKELSSGHGGMLAEPWVSMLAKELTVALGEANAAQQGADKVVMEI